MSKTQNELKEIQKSQKVIERRIEFLSCGILFVVSNIMAKTSESSVGQIVGNVASIFALVAQIILGVIDIKETLDEDDDFE